VLEEVESNNNKEAEVLVTVEVEIGNSMEEV